MKITLRTILESLNNTFVDNRIIKTQSYTDAVITDKTITVSGINEIFPTNCYIQVLGSVFNNNFHKITATGSNFITSDTIVIDPRKAITVKACLIPQEILDFAALDHTIPTLKSEKIGDYSYTTDTPGINTYIQSNLSAYYKAVVI